MKRPAKLVPVLFLIFLTLNSNSLHARPHQLVDSVNALDRQISVTLTYLAEGQIAQARLLARQMAWRFPDFALAQLVSAELETVAALHHVRIADHLPIVERIVHLLLEARQRLSAAQASAIQGRDPSPRTQSLPADLVQIGTHLSHIVVVDLQASVLYQYDTRNQQAVLVRQHYIAGGESGFGKRREGDLKTPLGLYSINGYRSDDVLPDLYGSGALTLDYPNALDRHLGRTGYGIWLHGVPSRQRSRAPYSSEGCVTMSNEHLLQLSKNLEASGTQVVLTQNTVPLAEDARRALQTRLQSVFSRYQQAWLHTDKAALEALYVNPEPLLKRMASRATGLLRVSSNPDARTLMQEPDNAQDHYYWQAFSSINPAHISIFRHPDIVDERLASSQTMMTNATFGAADEYRITLYWEQGSDGVWRILTELMEGPGL